VSRRGDTRKGVGDNGFPASFAPASLTDPAVAKGPRQDVAPPLGPGADVYGPSRSDPTPRAKPLHRPIRWREGLAQPAPFLRMNTRADNNAVSADLRLPGQPTGPWNQPGRSTAFAARDVDRVGRGEVPVLERDAPSAPLSGGRRNPRAAGQAVRHRESSPARRPRGTTASIAPESSTGWTGMEAVATNGRPPARRCRSSAWARTGWASRSGGRCRTGAGSVQAEPQRPRARREATKHTHQSLTPLRQPRRRPVRPRPDVLLRGRGACDLAPVVR